MASGSQSVTKGKGLAIQSVKVIWDSQTTSTFIQLCVEQVQEETCLTPTSIRLGGSTSLKGLRRRPGEATQGRS